MHAPKRPIRMIRRLLRRGAPAMLALALLPACDPASGPISLLDFAAGPEEPQSAEELIAAAFEAERVKRLIAPYSGDTQVAILHEYDRLGRGPGAIEQAIAIVVGGGGSGNGSINSAIRRDAFNQTVHPLLTQYCASCHAGVGPGFPSIASSNSNAAYDAVVSNQKVSLSDPPRSRIVARLSSDRHYCWSTSCTDDGAEMQAAVERWAEIEASLGDTIDVNAIVSTSSTMAEGILDEQTGRHEDHVIAKWEFRTGSGDVAYDTSGVAPAIDLELSNVDWVSGWGLRFQGDGRAIGTEEASRKLYDQIARFGTGTLQYSVEAWVTPAGVDLEGPARIVSYSRNGGERNFTLGQVLYNYNFRNRNGASDSNGRPALQTDDDAERLQPTLQHVVLTYDPINGRRIYVNGDYTLDPEPSTAGPLFWNPDRHRVVLGDEVSGDRAWEGQIRFLAVHKAVLSEEEIQENFLQGVGQRFLVRFGLDNWVDSVGNYVEFTVKEFDDYSYLFCEPRVFGPPPMDYRIGGMRIDVNGVVSVSGQAFVHTDATATTSGQQISRLCAPIPKVDGAEDDRFTIFLEHLGEFQNVVAEAIPEPAPPVDDTELRPLLAVRTFDQINRSMASLTGVDPLTPNVRDTYQVVREQLPSTYDARSFLSSHQTAISKLALEYCDTMVDDPGLRTTFFDTSPAFPFDEPSTTAFDTQDERDRIIGPLMAKLVGDGLVSQPTRVEVGIALGNLMDSLTAGCDALSCPASRTQQIVKASCSAVLASAAVTLY